MTMITRVGRNGVIASRFGNYLNLAPLQTHCGVPTHRNFAYCPGMPTGTCVYYSREVELKPSKKCERMGFVPEVLQGLLPFRFIPILRY